MMAMLGRLESITVVQILFAAVYVKILDLAKLFSSE